MTGAAATEGDHRSSARCDVNDLLTSGAVRSCYYATRARDQRPGCEQLASVVYGPIALCADCDRRRSAVGKGTAPRHLPDPGPLTRIRPARRAVQAAEADLAATVTAARSAGHPWSAIAAALGISRQAAQQRFAPPPPPNVKDPLTTPAAAHDVDPPAPPAPSEVPPAPPDPPSPPSHVKDPLTTQAGAGDHNPPSPPENGDSHTSTPVDPPLAPCPGQPNGADPAVPTQRPPDPALLADIDLARHALDHAHAVLLAALTSARAAGHPWSAIAAALDPPGQPEQHHAVRT